MASSPSVPDHVFSLAELSLADLQTRLSKLAGAASEFGSSSDLPLVRIESAGGVACFLPQLSGPLRLQVDGSLGDYAFSYCRGCDIRIDGDCGHAVAEGLGGGVIRIRGDAGLAAGLAMSAGTLAVFGSAQGRVGAAMRGGELFVRGDVGDDTGVGMQRGTLVIGGDAGQRLGEPQGEGTIYLRGQAASLATGMVEQKLRKQDELRLGLLLINASTRGSAKEFRRVIPQWRLAEENAKQTGEVRPNW